MVRFRLLNERLALFLVRGMQIDSAMQGKDGIKNEKEAVGMETNFNQIEKVDMILVGSRLVLIQGAS